MLAPHVFVEQVGLRGDRGRPAATSSRATCAPGWPATTAIPDVTFWNWNDVWLDAAFRDWDIRPELTGITCPVLGVQGTADPYGTVAHVEAVRDTRPRAGRAAGARLRPRPAHGSADATTGAMLGLPGHPTVTGPITHQRDHRPAVHPVHRCGVTTRTAPVGGVVA